MQCIAGLQGGTYMQCILCVLQVTQCVVDGWPPVFQLQGASKSKTNLCRVDSMCEMLSCCCWL